MENFVHVFYKYTSINGIIDNSEHMKKHCTKVKTHETGSGLLLENDQQSIRTEAISKKYKSASVDYGVYRQWKRN